MRALKSARENKRGLTMKRLSLRTLRDSKGFTLVELLIVIAILGILTAVVLPNVSGLVGHGQTEGAKAEMATYGHDDG